VGGDSGHVEREQLVEDVIVAPSERVVVDVLFDKPGIATLEHRTPERTYVLAEITVGQDEADPELAKKFASLRVNDDLVAERERIAPYLEAEPDKTLAFVAEMGMGAEAMEAGTAVHACPMHPDIVATWASECPKCGMTLRPTASEEASDQHHQHEHSHDAAGGIEWEDDMVEVNRTTTPANMRWLLVDRDTGASNHAIGWRFRVGAQVKIRLVNEMDSDRPMHHPFHIHGAGRFLILSRDGVVEPNLVWKDTVLVRTGETVDILLDVSNPGLWMSHCHIAEHHESGMMFSFHVDA